jgi:hypothetical protein
MKWANVTHDDLKAALASIKNGFDPEAAQNLIEYFHERMSSGYPYDEEILRELMALVFSRMVEDKRTGSQAFGLKLWRGGYDRVDTTERDVKAAAFVVLLMRKDIRWQDAIGDAANFMFPDGEGDKAVKEAYAHYKSEVEHYPDGTLMEILGPFADTPLIKRVMAG